MQHSLKISILLYIFGCFYMVFGAYITASSVKSYTNRLFVFMTSTLAIWAFAYSIGNSAPTAEAGAFWLSVAVLGWGVFYSVFFHFTLILTGTKLLVKKGVAHALIYIPSIINVILFAPFGVLKDQQYLLVPSDFGWINVMPLTPGDIWFMIYYAVFSISSLVFLIRWRIKIDPQDPLKKHATYVLISAHIPLVLGLITETLPAILGISEFPKLAVTFMIAPVLTLFSTLRKINLIVKRERERIVSRESKELLEEDRLRLFQIVAAVYTAGSAITFLIRYFGINMPLKQELFVSALFLATGVVLRLVPYITKNHTIQNTIFLVISTLSVLYFLRLNAATGALTIWSMYILFLLFTVVLDSKIHAVIFTVFMVIIQIAFWIINPRVPVTIDGNEYLSRIAIIIISYFAIKYLTNEYASKIDAYKDFAIEQEVLERISSTFISVNKENVQEKVQEMMKMSGEVLKFNHAYLIGFSEDYEDANVFAAYSMDPEGHKSRPYHPGMKLKTASLPVVANMIAEGAPIICNDIENDHSYECVESKNLLLSRGIHSFYALPLAMEENAHLDGVLVIENYERSNENLKENRSYFLNMLVNMLRDTKKKTLYEEQLYSSAYFDEITKLANRNMVIMKLNQRIHELKGSEKIAILDIELENLRMIKDTFGHGLGEQILVKSAAILKEILGDKCEISRLGEGEFGVVLFNLESHEQAQECADKVITAFSTPIFTDTGVEELFVVVGIGIAIYPDNGEDAATLLKNADLAAYEARNSKEDIVFYSEQLEGNIAENTLYTNRLFKSLENREFFLEFQPQISCHEKKVTGVEALLRWTSDGKKRVPPDRFIPILEQTGLIYDVGLWVLDESLKEHNRLIAAGFPPIRFSVNLSVVQFEGENFISDLARIIKSNNVDPKYVELEITESLFSKDPEDVIKKLHQLKKIGVSISIDDFGKGYSSLNRLKFVPFDRIKIDKEIIDYIDLEQKAAPLTEIIILLARTFKAGVTAKGVETLEQANFLKSVACDEIQGYFYSKPLSPEALEEFLKIVPPVAN